MPKQQLRYDKMVEAALRGVVRSALKQVAESGLPGNHHFYLTFRTSFRGVRIPDYLRGQYPGEMTIILQYQFYGLEVGEDAFSVTLSFNNIHERLTVPFGAITTFADPSVNFALQFQPVMAERVAPESAGKEAGGEVEPVPVPTPPAGRSGGPPAGGEEKRGEVVALDAFSKKQ